METVQQHKASPWPFVGMGGLAALLFLDFGSVSFLRWWVVLLLVLLWVGLFFVACRWFMRYPDRMGLLPLVGLGGYVVAVGLTAAL